MEATRRTPRVRSFPAAPEPNAARARGFPTALESRCSRCGAGRRRGAHHPHPAPSRGGTRGERGKERKKGRGGLFLYCVLSGFSLGSSPGLVAMRGFGMDARGVERRESGREAESGRNARGVGRGEGRPVGRARLCPPRPAPRHRGAHGIRAGDRPGCGAGSGSGPRGKGGGDGGSGAGCAPGSDRRGCSGCGESAGTLMGTALGRPLPVRRLHGGSGTAGRAARLRPISLRLSFSFFLSSFSLFSF